MNNIVKIYSNLLYDKKINNFPYIEYAQIVYYFSRNIVYQSNRSLKVILLYIIIKHKLKNTKYIT